MKAPARPVGEPRNGATGLSRHSAYQMLGDARKLQGREGARVHNLTPTFQPRHLIRLPPVLGDEEPAVGRHDGFAIGEGFR